VGGRPDRGRVPQDQAESGPQAHALTRWLGIDAPDHAPRVTTMVIGAPGWLLLCSDGLWNYCSPAGDLAALVAQTAAAAAGGTARDRIGTGRLGQWPRRA